MKAALRWTLYVAGAVVGLIIIAVAAFFIAGNYMIKVGIEKGGSYALKVPVKVDNVDLSVFKGSIGIDGLVIDNPPGYEIPKLITLGHVKAAVIPSSLMTDVVELDYVVLDGADLAVEQKGLTTNLQQIINSLPKSEEEAQQAPGKKLRIKKLDIKNVNVTLKLLPIPGKMNKVTLKLDPIVMENLGTDQPLTMATLTSKILVALAAGVAGQATDLIPKDITEGVKSSLGKTGTLLKSGSEGLMNAGKGVGEGIGGLFGRKPKDPNKP